MEKSNHFSCVWHRLGIGGAAGSVIGDYTNSKITGVNLDKSTVFKRATAAGLLNIFSFGYGKGTGTLLKTFKDMFKPVIDDIASTLVGFGLGLLDMGANLTIEKAQKRTQTWEKTVRCAPIVSPIAPVHGGLAVMMCE